MKQCTTPEQTAKLIELGLKKPKSISGYYHRGPYEYDAEANEKMVVYDDTQYPIYAYSIGELIEMLPTIVDDFTLWIGRDERSNQWFVKYHPRTLVVDEELIDALYDMVVKLKEEGVI